MRLTKRITAISLAMALTITGTGFTSFAGTYSNADSIWNSEITQKLFDSTSGSLNITNLQVPTLAFDDKSIGLVWEKPEQYANIADYNIYINGTKQQDTARQNFSVNADWTDAYMKSFYKYYNGDGTTAAKSDVEMVKVDIHSYRATGLAPDTEYTFKVIAVDKNGTELGTAQQVTQKTTKAPEVFNINDFGAKTSEGYTSYDDEINQFIVNNTKAIQATIDACTPGGKVVIPEGTYVSGALWLKSDITLELDGTLWASPNSNHFEVGFLMYPFYTDTRGWGLLNACSTDETQSVENIRITGNGKVYGNGWKYGSGNTIADDGLTRKTYSLAGDVDTSVVGNEKYKIPTWVAGSKDKVFNYGILAADAAKKYLVNVAEDGVRRYSDDQLNALSSSTAAGTELAKTNAANAVDDLTSAYATRSSLIIMRNVDGVYIEDISVENPSNHTINILDSNNVAVNNVKAFSYDCNNGDGFGFGCSQNIICWNNFLDTGDDSINFAAAIGKGAQDVDAQSNSKIWIFGNYIHEGHGGAIAAGSHTANGITDILCEDNVMNHTDMPFRFKSAPTTGGYVSNITIRDCAIADSEQAFVLTTSYSDPNSASSTEYADVPSSFHDIVAYNITSYGTKNNTICVYADVDPIGNTQKPWHTHNKIYFQDVKFGNVGTNGSFKNYNGWETLTGCEDAIFYDVNTVSYSDSAVAKGYDVAWSNMKFCKNIQFLGTTLSTKNASTTNMEAVAVKPVWGTATATALSASDGKSATLNWDAATVSAGTVIYGVDTYVGDNKVDTVDGLTTESTTIIGLSAGVNYTFKVYASENSSSTNDKAACVAITNKTEGPSTAITTLGVLDTTSITAPSTITVKLDNELYTCAQATWTSALTNDSRVRGYNVYVNGDLTQTIYNWELTSAARIGTIATQVGRLTPGIENTIKIVAFTDSGVTYEYTESKITTLTNYDFKAPEFEENASVTATTQSNGDVVLTWNAAKDDTAVSGYRIYVDGTPIYAKEGDVFNPINGKYTTTATTYTITGLDLTKEHIFTVKAGDTWWKAATTMGTYDKMAGFNWTLNGISKTLVGIPQDPEITDPETTIPGNTDSGTTGANVGSDNTSQSGNATDISSDGSNLSAAKTGDVAPIYLFIITLCISMTVLLVISTKKKKSVD